jgi:hypothetical protein
MTTHLMEAVLLHAEKQTDGTQQSLDTVSGIQFLEYIFCNYANTFKNINFYSRFFALGTLQTYHSKFIISNSVLLLAA